MKTRILLVFLFVMLSATNTFALDKNRQVTPPPKEELHLVLTKSLYNQTLNMDEVTRKLVYVCYISGFLDAMQLEVSDPGAAKRFIDQCQGLTLGDLQAMSIKLKQENPQWRDVSPAFVLTIAIPRLRQGQTAFPGDSKAEPQVNNNLAK